ncbi:hypothetical protein VPHD479_0051 [Vibrio phage D479]
MKIRCWFGHEWEYYNHISDDFAFGAVSFEYRYCSRCGQVQVAIGNIVGMPTFSPTLYHSIPGVPVFGVRQGEVYIKAVRRG